MASVLEAGFRNKVNPTANSINMGDTVTVHFGHGSGGNTLAGTIKHFDFDTNALMLVQTNGTLTTIKEYTYITKP